MLARAARNTLAVGALRPSGSPELVGSAFLPHGHTGCIITSASVIDNAHENGGLDPAEHGVAIGVRSADAGIEWLWTARRVLAPAPGSPNFGLTVLQVEGRLNGAPFAAHSLEQLFADHGLTGLPIGGPSDLVAPVPATVSATAPAPAPTGDG